MLGKVGLKPLKATPPEARKYKKDGELYASQRDMDETPEEYRERVRNDIAEAPTAYYQRGEVVRLESEMEEHRFDIWQMGEVIHESERTGKAPRNPDACVRYGSTCAFFGVCSGEASLDDPALFRRSARVHPELSGDATPKEKGEDNGNTSNAAAE